jgi:hypothetical protein
MPPSIRAILVATTMLSAGLASMIVDRAPSAKAVAEVFIDEDGIRVEWDRAEAATLPELQIQPEPKRRPRRVTFAPPAGAQPEDYGFVVYHRGLPVADLHYLKQAETLDLNWKDPWQSAFRNPRLRRFYDSPLSVFLYVETFEVRLEIVGRPSDLGVQSADDLHRQVAQRLEGTFTLTIDGEGVRPELNRVQFLERRLRTSAAIEPPATAQMPFATLGAIYVAPRDGIPRTASATWNSFGADTPAVSGSVTDDFATLPAMLRPGNATLSWENLGNLDEPSLAEIAAPPSPLERYLPFVGAMAGLVFLGLLIYLWSRVRRDRGMSRKALLAAFVSLAMAVAAISRSRSEGTSQEEAREIVHALLYNVYRAFDRYHEEAIYDTLARSVSGDLLREAYLEARRSLEVASLGGARTRVKRVDIEQSEASPLADGQGFHAKCLWEVEGSVGHWGHIHERRNRYDAHLTIEPVDGVWKITSLELLNEERL